MPKLIIKNKSTKDKGNKNINAIENEKPVVVPSVKSSLIKTYLKSNRKLSLLSYISLLNKNYEPTKFIKAKSNVNNNRVRQIAALVRNKSIQAVHKKKKYPVLWLKRNVAQERFNYYKQLLRYKTLTLSDYNLLTDNFRNFLLKRSLPYPKLKPLSVSYKLAKRYNDLAYRKLRNRKIVNYIRLENQLNMLPKNSLSYVTFKKKHLAHKFLILKPKLRLRRFLRKWYNKFPNPNIKYAKNNLYKITRKIYARKNLKYRIKYKSKSRFRYKYESKYTFSKKKKLLVRKPHIQFLLKLRQSKNNLFATVTSTKSNPLLTRSVGCMGMSGPRRATPYAAGVLGKYVGRKLAKNFGRRFGYIVLKTHTTKHIKVCIKNIGLYFRRFAAILNLIPHPHGLPLRAKKVRRL